MLILTPISANVIPLKNPFFSLVDPYYKRFAFNYYYIFNFISKTCGKFFLSYYTRANKAKNTSIYYLSLYRRFFDYWSRPFQTQLLLRHTSHSEHLSSLNLCGSPQSVSSSLCSSCPFCLECATPPCPPDCSAY